MKRKLLFFVLAGLMAYSCSSETTYTDEEHFEEVEVWFGDRISSLKGERGWLKLSGLYWLEEGTTIMGSNPSNQIVLPADASPEILGGIRLTGNSIQFFPAEGAEIYMDDTLLTDTVRFDADASPEFTSGRLAWTVIRRDDLTGLRLFDEMSTVYTSFTGIERYPVDINWRTQATLVPYPEPATVPVANILGQVSYMESPGKLEFSLEGVTYQLEALEAANNRLFIILGDLTNRDATFQGGRYMYVDNPGPNGKVILDFNKAYNPPCAFSDYTTCQIPPAQNRLPIAIEAGEKRYRDKPGYLD
jgi:uncharacterized protein (DUF1684 family)